MSLKLNEGRQGHLQLHLEVVWANEDLSGVALSRIRMESGYGMFDKGKIGVCWRGAQEHKGGRDREMRV